MDKFSGIVLAGYGFSSGQSTSGTSDTQLTSYDTVIPADTLSDEGDYIMIEGAYTQPSSTVVRTIRVQIDATTKRAMAQTAINLADMIIRTKTKLIYRTSTTGSWGGVAWIDASGASPVSGQGYLTQAALTSADWTADQTLEMWAQCATSGSYLLTDLTITVHKGHAGAAV